MRRTLASVGWRLVMLLGGALVAGLAISSAASASTITAPASAMTSRRAEHLSGNRLLSVLISASSDEVVAVGRVAGAHLKVVLQQRSGRRWLARASATPRSGNYAVVWRPARVPTTGELRVALTYGHTVYAISAVTRLGHTAPVKVVDALAPGAVVIPATLLQVVSGQPNAGRARLSLAAGAPVPKVGTALVQNVTATQPGFIAVATKVVHLSSGRVSVITRPGTLAEAYSSFSAQINGPLGELSQSATPTAALADRMRAHDDGGGSASPGGKLDPQFSCSGSGTPAITPSIDLSDLHVSVLVTGPVPYINFSIGGQPKLNLTAAFTGSAACAADLTVKLPIADTPLSVKIGPEFSLSANGAISASYTYDPSFFYGFSVGLDSPFWDLKSFENHGGVNVSGNAKLSADFDISAEVGVDDLAGLQGTVGPDVTINAYPQNGQACASATDEMDASLSLHTDNPFWNWSYDIGSLSWDHGTLLAPTCTGPRTTSGPSSGGGTTTGSSSPSGSGGSSGPDSPGGPSGSGTSGGPSSSGSSGWSVVSSPDPSMSGGNELEGVACPAASSCTAVGYDAGGTIVEQWNGTIWSVASSPSASGTTNSILDGVACASPSDCMAVGWSGGYEYSDPLTEQWNGSRWSIISSPAPSGDSDEAQLNAVACTSGSQCIAVGSSGVGPLAPLVEQWDGSSWSIVSSAAGAGSLSGISCVTASDCTAVGGDLIEQWNGTDWTAITAPGTSSDLLSSVACTSVADCTAVGADGSDPLTEHWNGSTWSIVSSPSPPGGGRLSGVSCISGSDCTAVGSAMANGAPYGTLIEQWNGSAWSLVTSPIPESSDGKGELNAVACGSASDDCTAVGTDGKDSLIEDSSGLS